MKCSHCSLDYDNNSMIFQGKNAFCCNGCKNVFNLIHENNLEDFYKNASNLEKINENNSFDELSFSIKKVQNYEEISIMIENIHCDACVWLIEQMLIKNEGVIDINIRNKRAFIEYNPNKTNAKEILKTIANLGYTPLPYNPNISKNAKKTHINMHSRLIVAIACMMNVMWLSVARYAGYFEGMNQSTQDIINFAEFILATPVIFYSASVMFKSAFIALKNRFLNMDCLVSFGALIIYVYSIFAMFNKEPFIYFDSVVMIICFVFIGRFLEQRFKYDALENISFFKELMSASVCLENGDKISVSKVKPNDIIRVFNGDTILIDGVLKSPEAKLDMSAITGESDIKVLKRNDFIKSASKVSSGGFIYTATATFQDSYVNKLANLLNNTKKSQLERLTDKISFYFCFVIFSLALLCFLLNISNLNEAIVRSVSVLIIACPCALALSAPIANLLSIHEALKLKILFKEANFVESLSKIKAVAFDKTGVLTKNKLELISKISLNNDEKTILKTILLNNNHLIASSLIEHFKDIKELKSDYKYEQFSGLGARLNIGSKSYYLGNARFLNQNGIKAISLNETEVFFANDSKVLAHFVFKSLLNDNALELISYFHSQNIDVLMLTGDNEKAALKVANWLNISKVYAGLLPEQKLEIISQNKDILMVGDGVNDALALKRAEVGISFKNASDLALNSSDIVMLDDSLLSIKNAHLIASKTYKLIKSNLAISLIYNAIFVSAAFFGLVNPLIASIVMSLSSVCVVLNSARIKNISKKLRQNT